MTNERTKTSTLKAVKSFGTVDDEPSLCGVTVDRFQMYGDMDLEDDGGQDDDDREGD